MMAIVQNSRRLLIRVDSTYLSKSSEMQRTGSVSKTKTDLRPLIYFFYIKTKFYLSCYDIVLVLFYIGYEINEFRNFLIALTLLSIYVIHV